MKILELERSIIVHTWLSLVAPSNQMLSGSQYNNLIWSIFNLFIAGSLESVYFYLPFMVYYN